MTNTPDRRTDQNDYPEYGPDYAYPEHVRLTNRHKSWLPGRARLPSAAPWRLLSGCPSNSFNSTDFIIDATASEGVIDALASYDWPSERLFASVSFSFAAEKLYLYLAAGANFPGARFHEVMDPWMKSDVRPPEDFPHEGTGCWSSVFPARADDVALVAAIAARQLDSRTSDPVGDARLTVYTRQADGTVSILDAQPSA
jgi:hypothetical protein